MRSKLLRLITVAALVVVAAVFAACGGGDDATDQAADLGPDPATMVPADAPIYAEAVLRPEGDLADDLESALSKLLVTKDIGATLETEIDDALEADHKGLTYAADIEPWLGQRGAVFIDAANPRSGEPEGAAVVAVTDAAAAESFVDKVSKSDSDAKGSDYNGVEITETEDGAVAVDGDFLVAGVRDAVERAIDAKAGENFAGLSDDQTGLGNVPDDAVFEVSANPTGVVELIGKSGAMERAELAEVREQLETYGDGALTAWGTAEADSLGLGASSAATDQTVAPTDVLSTLSGDAWLAFGAGGVGEQIQTGIEQAEAALDAQLPKQAEEFAPDVDPLAEIERATGLDLAKDLAWINDVSGFVQGTSILGGFGAGVMMTTDDEAAAKKTMDALQSSIAGSRDVKVSPTEVGFDVQGVAVPFGARFALQDGQFVIAAGAVTVDDVVSPTTTLADSDAFNAAQGAIEDDLVPSLFVDFPPIIELIDSTGQISPDLEAARPYLNSLDFLIAGSGVSDGRATAQLVLGLQDQPESSADTEAAAVSVP